MGDMQKGGLEFAFWADLFSFRKKFHEPPVNNKEAEEKSWEELLIESNDIATKYADTDFNRYGIVKKQIMAIVEDLEAKSKDAPSLKAS